MKRDPAMQLAVHLAHHAQELTAVITRITAVSGPPAPGVAYHRTTDAEADMLCADCSKPFGKTYASLTIGITTAGDEITELVCVGCSDLRS